LFAFERFPAEVFDGLVAEFEAPALDDQIGGCLPTRKNKTDLLC
jgi:hypothetical protein